MRRVAQGSRLAGSRVLAIQDSAFLKLFPKDLWRNRDCAKRGPRNFHCSQFPHPATQLQ